MTERVTVTEARAEIIEAALALAAVQPGDTNAIIKSKAAADRLMVAISDHGIACREEGWHEGQRAAFQTSEQMCNADRRERGSTQVTDPVLGLARRFRALAAKVKP